MDYRYKLAYKDIDEAIVDIGVTNFTKGRRITVKVNDGSDYTFTFVNTKGDRINGVSAVRAGKMVILDLETLELIEQR